MPRRPQSMKTRIRPKIHQGPSSSPCRPRKSWINFKTIFNSIAQTSKKTKVQLNPINSRQINRMGLRPITQLRDETPLTCLSQTSVNMGCIKTKLLGLNPQSVTLAMSRLDQPPRPDRHRLPRGPSLRIIILLSLIIWAAIIVLLIWCFRKLETLVV